MNAEEREDKNVLINFLGLINPELKKIDSMVVERSSSTPPAARLNAQTIIQNSQPIQIIPKTNNPTQVIPKTINDLYPEGNLEAWPKNNIPLYPMPDEQAKEQTPIYPKNQILFDFMQENEKQKDSIVELLTKINDNLGKQNRDIINHLKGIKQTCDNIQILFERKKRKKKNESTSGQPIITQQ